MEKELDSVLYKLDLINQSLNPISAENDIYIKYLLPILMLLFSIGAKIVIDREASINDMMKSLFKVPTDLTFLCTSLLIAFTAYDIANNTRNLFFIIFFIFLGGVNIFLSRRASKAYDETDPKWRITIMGSGIISFVVFLLTIIFI